jgi:hypothetical protein
MATKKVNSRCGKILIQETLNQESSICSALPGYPVYSEAHPNIYLSNAGVYKFLENTGATSKF